MQADRAIRAARGLLRTQGPHALTRETLGRHLGIKPGEIRRRTGLRFVDIVEQARRTVGRCARWTPKARKDQILRAAVNVAKRRGLQALTRNAVAHVAGVSSGLVTHYYKADELRDAVIQEAVEQDIPRIIAEAIVARDPQVAQLSSDIKRRALESLK